MRWWVIVAIIGAAALLYVLATRNTLPVARKSGASTTGQSILDSANAGATKVRTLLQTIFGSKPKDDDE